MKVVHLTTPETIAVRDIPARREAAPREVLLEPLVVGISGTDSQHYRRGAPLKDGFRHPHILGTECVARVVAVERGIDPGLLGRRVVLDPVSPCHRCEWCADGLHALCPNARTLGCPPVQGALQQRLSWPAALCTPVPETMDDLLAVLTVPVAFVSQIIENSALPFMGRVAVVGCGHLGLIAIRVLRARGVGQIIAVDPLGWRREVALETGATVAMEPLEAMEVGKTPGRGVHVAIDLSNSSESSRTAVALARRGGRVVIGGIPLDNRVLIDAREARQKALTVQFARRPYNTMRRALELLDSGLVAGIERVITHTFPLDEVAEAFRMLRRTEDNIIKAVIMMPPYTPREESPERIHEAAAPPDATN